MAYLKDNELLDQNKTTTIKDLLKALRFTTTITNQRTLKIWYKELLDLGFIKKLSEDRIQLLI